MSAGHTNRSQKSCVSLTTQFTTKLQRGGANPLGSSVLLLGLESQFVRASIGTASQLTHSLADALPPVLCYGVHCCSLATYISFWMNRKHIGGARKVWDAGWLWWALKPPFRYWDWGHVTIHSYTQLSGSIGLCLKDINNGSDWKQFVNVANDSRKLSAALVPLLGTDLLHWPEWTMAALGCGSTGRHHILYVLQSQLKIIFGNSEIWFWNY